MVGVAFLRTCGTGLIFDIVERMCQREEDATCIAGDLISPDNNGGRFVLTIPSWSFECPLQMKDEILLFPHDKRCERFYQCQKGVAYLKFCPPSQYFDVKSGKCANGLDAVCINDL